MIQRVVRADFVPDKMVTRLGIEPRTYGLRVLRHLFWRGLECPGVMVRRAFRDYDAIWELWSGPGGCGVVIDLAGKWLASFQGWHCGEVRVLWVASGWQNGLLVAGKF